MDKKKLGEVLVKAKKLTPDKLKYALAMHEKIGGDFAPLLVKLGYVSDEDITAIIGKMEGISIVDISNLVIPQKLVESIPRDVIEKHNVLPVFRKEGQIRLAMSNINDYEAIEEIQFLTNCKVEPVLASKDAIRKAIIQFYYEEEHGDNEIVESHAVPEKKSIKDLLEDPAQAMNLQKALVALLVEKNVVSQEELVRKAKDLFGK